MSLRYRQLTPGGDYSFGHNIQDFIFDLQAVAQAIKTRMQLLKGSFWRDMADGLPLFQQILGASASASNLAVIDGILQDRILGTQGVTQITAFSSSFNRATRQYSFEATVQTQYSTTVIAGTL